MRLGREKDTKINLIGCRIWFFNPKRHETAPGWIRPFFEIFVFFVAREALSLHPCAASGIERPLAGVG
jgi:hypothetical protein